MSIKTLSKNIAKGSKINESVINVNDKVFFDNLPKGYTQEQVEDLRNYEKDYMLATCDALGQLAPDVKHDGAITMEYGMGYGYTGTHHADKGDDGWLVSSSVTKVLSDDIMTTYRNKLTDALDNL